MSAALIATENQARTLRTMVRATPIRPGLRINVLTALKRGTMTRAQANQRINMISGILRRSRQTPLPAIM